MDYDIILKDVIKNFKDITGYKIKDVINEGEFIQHKIDETAPDIIHYINTNYNIDCLTTKHEDLLYLLDDEIIKNYYK